MITYCGAFRVWKLSIGSGSGTESRSLAWRHHIDQVQHSPYAGSGYEPWACTSVKEVNPDKHLDQGLQLDKFSKTRNKQAWKLDPPPSSSVARGSVVEMSR